MFKIPRFKIPDLSRFKIPFRSGKPETPRDWLDAYLKTEYGDDVPDVPDDEVLSTVPSHLTEEDLDRYVLQHAIRTAPVVRQRVAHQLKRTEKPEAPKGFQLFRSMLDRDPRLANVFKSFGMVFVLLLNRSQIPTKDRLPVFRAMGMEEENLFTLMRALLSRLQGRVVQAKDVVDYLTTDLTVAQILYKNLGLNDNSTETEVRVKCEALKQATDRFDELLAYPDADEVIDAVEAVAGNENRELNTRDILTAGFQLPLGRRLVFDQDYATQTLTEVEEGQKNAYYAAFCAANSSMPALAMLDNMAAAFSARDAEYAARYQGPYFNGQSAAEVVGVLDGLFSEIPGFGRELLLAGMNGNAQTLVRRINECYKLTSPQELYAKLTQFYQAIRHQYRGLDPLRGKPKETAEQPEIDFTTYWEEIKSDPETCRVYHQLHQLHFALRRSEERYDAKNRRQHFEDLDRVTVLAALNSTLGADLVAAMQTAADMGKDTPYQFYALIEAIAKHSNMTKDPDKLKRRLCEVGDTLHDLFPDLSA